MYPYPQVNDGTPDFTKTLEPNGFSIVIPTFNRSPSVRRALISIFKQEYNGPPVEVIIVNDGSTDGFYEQIPLAFKYKPDWVERVVICDKFGKNEWTSPANSYNEGFKFISKNYVIHYGSDMIFCHNKVMQSIYKHCDIDRYLFFPQRRLKEEDVNKITDENIFEFVMNNGWINNNSENYPYVAVTSLDALQKIGFYSDGFLKGQYDDTEMLRKLEIIFIKFFKITDRYVCHQEHQHIATTNSAHNKGVYDRGVNALYARIKSGEVVTYA